MAPSRSRAVLLVAGALSLLLLVGAADASAGPVAVDGSTVAGVDVSGQSGDEALVTVQSAFAKPVVIRAGRYRFRVTSSQVGATYGIEAAVAEAVARPTAGNTPVEATVDEALLEARVDRIVRLATRRGTAPSWRLTRTRPILRLGRPAGVPSRREIESQIRRALALPLLRDQLPKVRLRAERRRVRVADVGYVIVVSKPERALRVFAPWRNRAAVVRWFRVAVGAPSFPTPTGVYRIVDKQVDPWWYPPDAPWAAGAEPVPPGPGNPLGTRWMGLDRDGIGIHGTPDSGSIGGYASHGCIRMLIHSAEQLFALVPTGTPVIIR